MLNHPTYDKLTQLKLFGMARAFAEQSTLDLGHLGFDERLGLLVDHETTERDGKALALRLQRAKLKPNTVAEDTDYRHARGLDKALFQRLLGTDRPPFSDGVSGALFFREVDQLLEHPWARHGLDVRWPIKPAGKATAPTTCACRACSTN